MQQLPRGKNHDTSTFWWGHGPFSNNFFFAGMFFKKKNKIAWTKIKICPNYNDENHI